MDDYSDPDLEAGFNEPMPWIGVYIALASLTCALAMLADLSHGFLKQKIGLPCKYFTMNAVYLSLMAIAMKLPVDLNNPMIGVQDQAAKLGSLAFMCTMMANCLPSLATMDGKELLSNILALGVLVITIIVNVGIQIETVEEGLELNEVALQNILKSVNRLIEKAQKQQPKNLTQLLQGSEGVGKFDINRVKLLLEEVSIDCWSLPLITLTTIAISLPNIQKNIVESLLSSVSEGLVYVTHVEESPDSKRDYVSIHKVTKKLWQEVELYHKWIGKKLKEHVPQANTAEPILQWFTDTSQAIVDEVVHSGLNNDDSTYRRTSADSMKRITERMMLSCDPNMVSEEELFKQLSSMISNIFVSCLTKLPQVIVTKCHTNVIKKREASIHAAAQLLGETMQIINVLQGHGVQPVDLDGSSFFSKCRAYIRSSRIWVKLFSGATPSS